MFIPHELYQKLIELNEQLQQLSVEIINSCPYKVGDYVTPIDDDVICFVSDVYIVYDSIYMELRKLKKDGSPSRNIYTKRISPHRVNRANHP